MAYHDQHFLNKLTSVIEQNIDNAKFDVKVLEQHFCMSKMQLYRKLKSLLQLAPGAYIRLLRLDHAASLLQNTPLSIAAISGMSGFRNRSFFFRAFKKRFGFPPNAYRNLRKMDLAADCTVQ